MSTTIFLLALLILSADAFVSSNRVKSSHVRLFAATHASLCDKRVLVVGGSGRVGGSCVTQLIKRGANVVVGGTDRNSFERSKRRWKENNSESSFDDVTFVKVDREQASTIRDALDDKIDLVIHTAGPFQGKVNVDNGVLEACVETAVPYIDVCDDYCTARAAKAKFAEKAISAGVPCIISTGCWPGVSSLMAKQLTSKVLKSDPKLKPEDLKVDFSFFTTGSGGAGSTLLVATFLILAEEALTIVNGRRRPVSSMKEYTTINFGPIVGDKSVAHLNLLETASIHDILGIGSVRSLFGTAPDFWNALLGVMAQLPKDLLANESLMTKLALFSLPIVRIVDSFAGATNAMRCDVSTTTASDTKVSALYAHDNLEPCVGECVVAFAASVMDKNVKPGVWFPEEAISEGADAASVLSLASVGAHTVEVEGNIDIRKEEIWGASKTAATTKLQTAV